VELVPHQPGLGGAESPEEDAAPEPNQEPGEGELAPAP